MYKKISQLKSHACGTVLNDLTSYRKKIIEKIRENPTGHGRNWWTRKLSNMTIEKDQRYQGWKEGRSSSQFPPIYITKFPGELINRSGVCFCF